MNRYVLPLILALFTPTLALATVAESCTANFSADGSFFKGKTFKTHIETIGVEFTDAFRRVAQAVAREGWAQVHADKELGQITATMDVANGKGSVVPLNVIMEDKGKGGVTAEAIMKLQAGKTASDDSARDALCKVLVAAQG